MGLIGYPNVGKSSVINTLKSSKVCRVAPIPGETKVWQYITLTRRIYLIDCPGIVPSSSNDSHTSIVLKGVVRVEALPQPSEHIAALLERVKPIYISRTYGVPLHPPKDDGEPTIWEAEKLLETLAKMKGRLLKGGEPDLEGVSKMVLNDWVRGKLPFFVPPPEREDGGESIAAPSHGDQEKRLKPVPQKLSGIIQKNKFEGEDVKAIEEPEGLADSEEEPEGDEGDSEPDEAGDEDAPELDWEDVFGAVEGPTGQVRPKSATTRESTSTAFKGKRKGTFLNRRILFCVTQRCPP